MDRGQTSTKHNPPQHPTGLGCRVYLCPPSWRGSSLFLLLHWVTQAYAIKRTVRGHGLCKYTVTSKMCPSLGHDLHSTCVNLSDDCHRPCYMQLTPRLLAPVLAEDVAGEQCSRTNKADNKGVLAVGRRSCDTHARLCSINSPAGKQGISPGHTGPQGSADALLGKPWHRHSWQPSPKDP